MRRKKIQEIIYFTLEKNVNVEEEDEDKPKKWTENRERDREEESYTCTLYKKVCRKKISSMSMENTSSGLYVIIGDH